MKVKCLKLKNWLLVSVMSLVGLLACKKDPSEPDGPRVMYGVPTSGFHCVPVSDGIQSDADIPKQDVINAENDED